VVKAMVAFHWWDVALLFELAAVLALILGIIWCVRQRRASGHDGHGNI